MKINSRGHIWGDLINVFWSTMWRFLRKRFAFNVKCIQLFPSLFLFAHLAVRFYKQKAQYYNQVKEKSTFFNNNLFKKKSCVWLVVFLYANIPIKDTGIATRIYVERWVCARATITCMWIVLEDWFKIIGNHLLAIKSVIKNRIVQQNANHPHELCLFVLGWMFPLLIQKIIWNWRSWRPLKSLLSFKGRGRASSNKELGGLCKVLHLKGGIIPGPHSLYSAQFTLKFLSTVFLQRIVG